jgi:hypothetical protein
LMTGELPGNVRDACDPRFEIAFSAGLYSPRYDYRDRAGIIADVFVECMFTVQGYASYAYLNSGRCGGDLPSPDCYLLAGYRFWDTLFPVYDSSNRCDIFNLSGLRAQLPCLEQTLSVCFRELIPTGYLPAASTSPAYPKEGTRRHPASVSLVVLGSKTASVSWPVGIKKNA